MDERMRREWAATEAEALGRGGIAAVSQATGISRPTIAAGIRQARQTADEAVPAGRIRRAGGGRKRITHRDPTLLRDLESLVDPLTRGGPRSPLRWTCKSTRTLAAELVAMGHQFAYITQNWRGQPLISHEVIVNPIASTTTRTGLRVHAELDTNVCPTGKKVTDGEFAELRITRDSFHGEWNYKIEPRESVN
jgi:hypothetical protein